MKKNAIKSITISNAGYSLKKFLLIMKLTTILLVVAFVQVSAKSLSQSISIIGKDIPIKEVFKTIESQSTYTFFYDIKVLHDVKVSLELTDASIEETLNAVFTSIPSVSYKVVRNNVVITTMENQTKPLTISGVVYDKQGLPIPGVNVTV